MLKVLGYCRVSTEDQAREGVSLAAQRGKVEQYARLYDLELVETITDAGVSAKTIDRPGLNRALALLDSGAAGGMVITKLDRLTRSVSDLAALIDRYFGESGGRQLFSLGDSIDTRTAAGRLVLNVLISVSQWEREVIVERTRAAVAYKRSRGERISRHIPYGFQLAADGRSLVPVPAEAEAVALVRLLGSEGRPARQIAAELDRRQIPTRGGNPWHESSVRKILKRPA